ncbi:MAG: hypothetical protein JW922_09635 [Paludibacteraceae bacterium]|nr:hypothetical protein [Paludibacteraceae bacterium]
MNFLKTLLYLLFMIIATNQLHGQNLEIVGDRFKQKPVTYSGNLAVSSIIYNNTGSYNRQSPLSYLLSGNLNIGLYGWNIPLTFRYSENKSSYSHPMLQPYNHYGLTPYYKWVKIYLGRSNMNMSPLTLGTQFFGAGVELTPPGLFKISAMYGKLQDAFDSDTINNTSFQYKRMAYALKAEVGNETSFVNIVIFKAQDIKESVTFIPDTFEVKPQDNLVLNLNGSTTIAKNIVLRAEYATSALTADTRSVGINNSLQTMYKPYAFLYKNKTSTSYSNALKSQVMYNHKLFSAGVAYDRIGASFTSLGLPYFSNDLENIRLNFATSLFNKKIQLNANIGKQRNNLDADRATSSKNTVTAINIIFNPNPKLNFSGAYSNFNSFARVESNFKYINQLYPYDDSDTLNYAQVSQSENLNMTYILSPLGSKTKYQSINISVSYQQVADRKGNNNMVPGAKNFNSNLSYAHNLIEKNLSVSASVISNIYTGNGKNLTIGPSLSLSKLFFEKTMRTSCSIAYNKSYIEGSENADILNFRLSGNYSIKKKHEINSSLALLNKMSQGQDTKAFFESTFTIGYRYNFGNNKTDHN